MFLDEEMLYSTNTPSEMQHFYYESYCYFSHTSYFIQCCPGERIYNTAVKGFTNVVEESLNSPLCTLYCKFGGHIFAGTRCQQHNTFPLPS